MVTCCFTHAGMNYLYKDLPNELHNILHNDLHKDLFHDIPGLHNYIEIICMLTSMMNCKKQTILTMRILVTFWSLFQFFGIHLFLDTLKRGSSDN